LIYFFCILICIIKFINNNNHYLNIFNFIFFFFFKKKKKEFNNNLTALKEADPVVPEIGNVFLKIAEKLKVYKEYCSNYPLALSLLRELTQKPDVKNLLTVNIYFLFIYFNIKNN